MNRIAIVLGIETDATVDTVTQAVLNFAVENGKVIHFEVKEVAGA